MNWTGGAFARHSRQDRSLTRRQKQHFARARGANRLDGRRSVSPWKLAFAKDATFPASPLSLDASVGAQTRPHASGAARTSCAQTGASHEDPADNAAAAALASGVAFGEPRFSRTTGRRRDGRRHPPIQPTPSRPPSARPAFDEQRTTLLGREDWTATRLPARTSPRLTYRPPPANPRDVGKRRRVAGHGQQPFIAPPPYGTSEAPHAHLSDRETQMGRPGEIGLQIGDRTKVGRASRPTLESTRVHGGQLRRPSVRVQHRASPRPVRRLYSTGGLPHSVPAVVQNSRGRSSSRGSSSSRVASPKPHAADSLDRPSHATRMPEAARRIVDSRRHVKPRALGDAVARAPTLNSARTSSHTHYRDAPSTGPRPFCLPQGAFYPSSDVSGSGSSGPRSGAGIDSGTPTDAHAQAFRLHARPTVDRLASVSPTPMGSEVSYLTEAMRHGSRPSSAGLVRHPQEYGRDTGISGVDRVIAATDDDHLSDADSFKPLEEDACSLGAASGCPGLASSEARLAGEINPRVESRGKERSVDADEGWKLFVFGDEGSDDASAVR
ncbi:MAG: hypothetical protein M1815_002700 [Lichina confinis]|nr:MAG: hypothetical protein M1815_002700 [Lichina confinis]